MGMQRISKQVLAERLNKAIGQEVGLEGLNTLLYGWRVRRKFGEKYCKALLNRDWLYITEVIDFSHYAGYDLTGKE